jgi:serine/threonine-protein kinase ULK/ATG1
MNYAKRDLQATGALVAVKQVNLTKLSKKLKENLYCEIEILRGLHHPHIVALIDIKETTSNINLVMEYCELGDLSYFIKKRDKLQDNPALQDMVRKYPMPAAGGLHEVVVRHFLKQLASAMEYMNDRDFIHRDVKPQNLLILPSKEYLARCKNAPLVMSASENTLEPMVGLTSLPMLKIADFGFARSLPATSMAETLCGSPLYMAPEILRYEKYDARVDLWSVGTVLYEMVTGKPPFRATNHVELLRKIEQSDDHIKFARDVIVTPEMKELIRALLRRKPGDRILFAKFFNHSVVKDPIPGLVGDDRPRELPKPSASRDVPLSRTHSQRSSHSNSSRAEPAISSSPRDRTMPPSPRTQVIDPVRQLAGTPPRAALERRPSLREHRQVSARPPSTEQTREQRRPPIVPSATAPNPEAIHGRRIPSQPQAMTSTQNRRGSLRQQSIDEEPRRERAATSSRTPDAVSDAAAAAAQEVQDAREYVLVEKRAVEVNAFADEMAASPRLQAGAKPSSLSRGTQMTRRATTQGAPTSATGAVPASPSRVVQIAQGRPRQDIVTQRQSSYGRSYGSPSATSAIAKAINLASVRMFGMGWSPSLIGKGMSPPQAYSAFPAYPAPHSPIGLLGDGRPSAPIDEDQKTISIIEESANRSDVVYGFAEVKYKQLIPLAPSMDHGLGGANRNAESLDEDDLTVEAVVALSEEALVLYVKALSLLAKSMDIAGLWWAQRNRSDGHRPESPSPTTNAHINGAVQWVRSRFNEVLEKTDLVRMKLIEAQKQLPEDHPGHPSQHTSSSRFGGTSSADGYFLTSGITAERLMYDRALEMSRSAAINEIANEDLPGVERSYMTALKMLEAILETDEEPPSQRKRSSSLREQVSQGDEAELVLAEDRKAVQKSK